MTVKEPQAETDRSTPRSPGVAGEIPHAAPGTAPAGRMPPDRGAPVRARKPDYRLRGLNLEAEGLAELQPQMVRKAHPSRRRRRRRRAVQAVVVALVLVATAGYLRASVIRPYAVRTTSMVPTLQPGTNVLVLRPRLLTGSIHTGDIVVFHRPQRFSCNVPGDDSRDLVKRVIALPGQTVWSAHEQIYIDGRPLKESGWYNPPFGELGTAQIPLTTIPSGSYFVLGDNRTDPCDSRSFGPVAKSSVVGEVVATVSRNGHPSVHVF